MQIEILGILLGLALYPYVYTASRVSFNLIGSTYINMSKNLGLSSTKLFFKVIIPLSKPAIFSGLFLVIMEVLNEYGAVKYLELIPTLQEFLELGFQWEMKTLPFSLHVY